MKILLTGASGFVGRRVLAATCFQSCRIVPAVRRPSGLDDEKVVGEIGPETDWRDALVGCDTVVHLAARVHVMRDSAPDSQSKFHEVNALGTLNLARQAIQSGVRRFVFISSIKVNGEHSLPHKPFRADDEPAPADYYALSKLEAERGLIELSRNHPFEVVIIRPPLLYGPGVKGNFSTMTSWLKRGIPLPLAAIHNRRSLLAVDNLVDFVSVCVDRSRSPAAANRVFLISDNDDLSTPELLRRVAKVFGVKARLFPVPFCILRTAARALGRTTELVRLAGDLVVDSSAASTLLGWRPVVSLEQQLEIR